VRLNPNIPWKTRGNAALAVRFGHGSGRNWRIGELPDGPVVAHGRGSPLTPAEAERLESALWETVRSTSRTGEAGTDPAMAVSARRPGPELYRRAVTEVVPVPEARAALEAVGGHVRTLDSSRGIVGAAAALSWPARRRTFELIAYRAPEREVSRRSVDATSVRRAQRRFPELFLCYDPRTRRTLVTPHTPCPILFGLRATRPHRLEAAFRSIRSEPVDRWLIFATNQATGDHVRDVAASEVPPYGAARLTGRVAGPAETGKGGHVRFELEDPSGILTPCLVFEPTKTLPRIARALAPGDSVRVWGGRGLDPQFRVEGIEVRRLSPRWGPPTPPLCPSCRRRTRSLGTARGFRCPACHRRFPPEEAHRERRPPGIEPGTYHPTASARRHLHPLAPEV
jgi:tRNA(Ile2)-agmatinylcytidine synthase